MKITYSHLFCETVEVARSLPKRPETAELYTYLTFVYRNCYSLFANSRLIRVNLSSAIVDTHLVGTYETVSIILEEV